MASNKCCVVGCDSTSNTHKLFCMPMNDKLRNLWLSFLVPTSPYLLMMTKNQLRTKRVCERHFDQSQFDQAGVRIRYSYPCLFSEKEISHGVPLSKGDKILDEHNYFHNLEQDDDNFGEGTITTSDPSQEHQYSFSTSLSRDNLQMQNKDHASKSVMASTSTCTEKAQDIEYIQSVTGNCDIIQQAMEDSLIVASTSSCTEMNRNNEYIQSVTGNCDIIQQATEDSLIDNIATPKSISNVVLGNTKIRGVPKNKVGKGQIKKNTRFKKNMKELADNDKAKDVGQITPFMSNLNKLSVPARNFLNMQLKVAGKKKNAIRYTNEEKLLSLTLMKESPTGYELLQKIFTLPSKRSLKRLAGNVSLEPSLDHSTTEKINRDIEHEEEIMFK